MVHTRSQAANNKKDEKDIDVDSVILKKLSGKKYEVSKEIGIRIAQKNVRVNCRECPRAEIPKKINTVLTRILRHELWNR